MAPDDFPAGGSTSDYLVFWVAWLVVLGGTVFFFRATRRKKGAARLVAGNALMLASLLATLVLAGETYLRYVYDATDSYGLMLTNDSWFKRHVVKNPDGFRDRTWPREKRPGVERIGCIGDSFTLGWGVKDVADCWPQRIGAALDAHAPNRYEVWNCGRVGYTTSTEVELLEQMLPVVRFDRVILGYCLNDPDDFLPPDRWFVRTDAPRVPILPPTSSFLADFLWYRLRLRDDPRVRYYYPYELEAYLDPALWRRECEQFARMARDCSSSGVKLQVVVFPFFNDWGPDYRFGVCHDRVQEAFKQLGVETIDLREAYRGIPGSELMASRFDAHPNARAHEIAARTILERAFGLR